MITIYSESYNRGKNIAQNCNEAFFTLLEKFQLWEQPFEVMCQTVCKAKVKDCMQEPTEGEFVSETDTLNIAAHRIVMGHHLSLLVTQGRVIVGILEIHGPI